MKNLFFKKSACGEGFTLIELLVVVLIIGILASIAVPQYMKIVLRSKYTQLITLTSNLASSCDRYYELNGEYPAVWGDLDIKLPDSYIVDLTGPHFAVTTNNMYTIDLYDGASKNISSFLGDPHVIAYVVWLKEDNNPRSGLQECWADPDAKHSSSICEGLGGKLQGSAGGSYRPTWKRYILNN